MLGIFSITEALLQWEAQIASMLFYVYALTSTFQYKSKFVSFVKAFFTYLLGYIIFFIAVILVSLVIIIKSVIENPEMFQQQG